MNDMSIMRWPGNLLAEFSKRWMAIAHEMIDHTRSSFEDATSTFAKLMSATSVDQAIETQTESAQRAYETHLQRMTKINGMCAELAKVPAQAKQ